MSIRDEINARVTEGRLCRLELSLDSDPVERHMFLTPDVMALLEGPWEDESIRRRAGRLRGDLEMFVKGEMLSVCLTPYRAGDAYMGRLDKPEDEIWDIRSRDPRPGLRVFGRFAETDVFVAMCWRPRSKNWGGRRQMGGRNSLEWHLEIIQCKQQWEKLFPGIGALHGDQISDYISDKTFPVGD